MRGSRSQAISNLAVFSSCQEALFAEFAEMASRHLTPAHIFVVTADDRVAASARSAWRKHRPKIAFDNGNFSELGFLKVPISFREIERSLSDWLAENTKKSIGPALLAVDMSWGLQTPSATANFESWMALVESLVARSRTSVASLYNRRLLIDEQLLAALHGHPKILTAAGVKENPHWLPAGLLSHGTLRQRVDHWLGEISPDFGALPSAASHAAEGADPMWLLRRSADEPVAVPAESPDRWKIRCFGRLRVYRNDGSQVNWEISGGATRKTKTLFAYLLQKGGRGATADELADLLWPNADHAQIARNRLYHTVKCLRAALSSSASRGAQSPEHVIRDGPRYVLVPPERSWLDISTYEQLCRQSQSHLKSGANEEALICLQAADRLYTGDLFEDIPAEYADNSESDWCWSKRYWLRDMFFKVQRDAARIHRERGDYSAALAHCQKALAIDPLCEMAHEEAMQVFFAQGRREAIDRQYKLYLDSLAHFDDRPQSAALRQSYQRLAAAN